MNQQEEDLKAAGQGPVTTTLTPCTSVKDDTQSSCDKKIQSTTVADGNTDNNNKMFCVMDEADETTASTFHGRITVGTVMEEDSFSSSSADECNENGCMDDCEVALVEECLDGGAAAAAAANAYDDIFGSRQGKTLTWTNVNMTLVSAYY